MDTRAVEILLTINNKLDLLIQAAYPEQQNKKEGEK